MVTAETAERAAVLVQLPMKDKEGKEEYVRILHVSANSFYFQLKFEKLESIVKEIKTVLPDITDIELRSNLLNAISLSIYAKYRWYQFPEEAFTHLELQLQLTSQLEDKFHMLIHIAWRIIFIYSMKNSRCRENIFQMALNCWMERIFMYC